MEGLLFAETNPRLTDRIVYEFSQRWNEGKGCGLGTRTGRRPCVFGYSCSEASCTNHQEFRLLFNVSSENPGIDEFSNSDHTAKGNSYCLYVPRSEWKGTRRSEDGHHGSKMWKKWAGLYPFLFLFLNLAPNVMKRWNISCNLITVRMEVTSSQPMVLRTSAHALRIQVLLGCAGRRNFLKLKFFDKNFHEFSS